MPYPFTNKKRIRGWPNKIRELDRLEESSRHLDKEMLHTHGYCTYELLISPFSNLTPRNPPGWYLRKYIDSMIRISNIWKKEIEQEAEKYYLAIWLCSPHTMKSQVVAAIGDRIDRYENLFRERNENARFPQCVSHLQDQYVWKCKWDYSEHWQDSDDLTEKEIRHLRNRSAIEEIRGSETVYLLPKGSIWVSHLHPGA